MTTSETQDKTLVTRREAVQRVAALLGGVALVGGTGLITGCREERPAGEPASQAGAFEKFTAEEIAFLDEIAETILPATKTPGAKAAATGAFMALMVTDSYQPADQKVFRQGMRTLDEASKKANQKSFVQATPEQRLALLQQYDKEQKADNDARAARHKATVAAGAKSPAAPPTAEQKNSSDKNLPDQRKENAIGAEVGSAAAVTADAPKHFFRMMKELALLGYFTSEIGYNQAQRYQESPGRFDPCTPYVKGEPAWASHA